jgi:hypothetical protein
MKNTGFVTIELDPSPSIGDIVQVVGTSVGTGGWKIVAGATDRIQLSTQSPTPLQTSIGGEIVIASTNYRDVITMMYADAGLWIIINKIFANNQIPLFN